MSNVQNNTSLDRVTMNKETTMGTPDVTYLHDGTTKGIGIEQVRTTPFVWNENNNQTQIEVSRNSHISSNNTILNGRKDLTLDVTSNIFKNDFLAIASKVFQNYIFNGLLFDTTVTAVVNSTFVSTLTVADASNIVKGQEFTLAGRVDSTEDKKYKITAVSGTDVTIDALLDDTDQAGTFKSTIGVHSLKIQKDTCNKIFNQSYSMWLPNRNETCESGQLVTGIAPKQLSLQLMEATYQFMARAKNLERKFTNQPMYSSDDNVTDYLKPDTDNDGASGTSAAVLGFKNNDGDWVDVLTSELNCDFVINVNEDQGAFIANKYAVIINDGISTAGSYSAFVKNQDDANSISNMIIDRRADTTNEISGRLKLINEDGTGFYVEGNISFLNPTLPDKAVGGFSFSSDFVFTTNDTYDNIEMVVYNNYTTDITTYL